MFGGASGGGCGGGCCYGFWATWNDVAWEVTAGIFETVADVWDAMTWIGSYLPMQREYVTVKLGKTSWTITPTNDCFVYVREVIPALGLASDAYIRNGLKNLNDDDKLIVGNSYDLVIRMRGGTTKKTATATPAPKAKAKAKAKAAAAPNIPNTTSDAKAKADAKAAAASLKVAEKEKKAAEKLAAEQQKNVDKLKAELDTATAKAASASGSSGKVVGTPPKSSARFSSDAYSRYRQELQLWFSANSTVADDAIKFLLVQSLDEDLKRHMLRSMPAMLQPGVSLNVQAFLNTLDRYFAFSSVVENQKVIDEIMQTRQNSSTLFQFVQVQRNNLGRLRAIGYEASDLVDRFLKQYSQLSRREIGTIMLSIDNLRTSDLEMSCYDVCELAFTEIDVYAKSQELSRSLQPQSGRGKGGREAYVAGDDDDAWTAETNNNGRGKGTGKGRRGKGKGKGKGGKSGKQNNGNNNGNGKGNGKGKGGGNNSVQRGIGKWQQRQQEGAAAPRPRPPPGWYAAKDWKCVCGAFMYNSRKFCTHCKEPRPSTDAKPDGNVQKIAQSVFALLQSHLQGAPAVPPIPTVVWQQDEQPAGAAAIPAASNVQQPASVAATAQVPGAWMLKIPSNAKMSADSNGP